MMELSVNLFARARDLAQAPVVSLSLADGATVANLRDALLAQHPALAPLRSHLLIAVNDDYVSESFVLASGQRISCFPPVSGG